VRIAHSPDPIGADVFDADLTRPLPEPDFATISQAFDERSVLCFRAQQLSPRALIDFARRFGEVERVFLTHYAHPEHPEIMLVSNVRENGRDIGHADAGRVWHTDMSYTARPPRATLLYAIEVPTQDGRSLGNTEFASAVHAWATLPEERKTSLAPLKAIHQVAGRRARTGTGQWDQALRHEQPTVVHPVARTHPVTGRKSLYVSHGECQGIEGMAEEDALPLIAELADRIVEPRFRHTHRWQVGDLLMWDNVSVQHLASFDYQWPQHRRLMHRVTVGGTVPV